MRLVSVVCAVAAAAASAGAQGYRPVGTGGAFYLGPNFPSLDGVREEFDVLALGTPAYTFMMGGTFRYNFPNGLQIGYYGGGWGFSTGRIFDDGVVKNCEIDFGVHQAVAGYKMYFGERLGFFAGGGAGVLHLSYTKTISSAPYRFGNVPFPESATYVSELEGFNWSAQAFVAPQYRVLPWLGVGCEAGYFFMKVPAGELTQVGTKMAAAPEVDLSGPFVRAGPMFNF
ncbi:MAG: hypothetical protein GTN49_04750 [candidate division Zixibacteria bacterium]|nr:hypothetical protein [candidate division Zixibacteria bacterium]